MMNSTTDLKLDSLDEIISLLQEGQLSFDIATRMILALQAQGKISSQEIEEKTKDLIIGGRSLYNELGNVSLRDEAADL